ncbi:ANTAR domain protein with unknown sensor [Kribbella flavida DSM 17836]|uniref:ANTAR domain-containing protein n=2 Tax=Kribbella flavida TaxID=182640 RepID=D2PS21_KRIFD|nr:ANTAR domain protein with unknown sensor [Kribbella flavida DSM 17836]
MSMEHSSAEAFGRLAAELQDADGVEQTVEAVVQYALQAVWCEYASVVLITKRRRPQIMALTDPKLAELYRSQIDAGTGPMITALEQRSALLIPDVLAEARWSAQWSEQMVAAGIRSAMHLPMLVAGRPEAVLSLYSDKPDGFTDDDLAVAHILAQHGSAAVAAARNQVSLTEAVDARKLVGQALGILMERYRLDEVRAFEVLRRYSQDNNRKLRDVAQELLDTRELPTSSQRRM